jgi:hypothetical protein
MILKYIQGELLSAAGGGNPESGEINRKGAISPVESCGL